MKEATEHARVRGQPEVETGVLAVLLTRYDQIVQAGYQINPLVTKPKKSDQYKRLPGRPRQSPARKRHGPLCPAEVGCAPLLVGFDGALR